MSQYLFNSAGLNIRSVRSIGRLLLAQRTILFGAAIAAGIIGFIWSGWTYFDRTNQNAKLKAIQASEDVAVNSENWGGVIIARVRYLDSLDRNDEAQALMDEALPRLSPDMRAALLYNHANALVQKAIGRIERSDLDGAIPLINVAKDAYRRALRLVPDHYDAKYNYDVAMRLVRDFPPAAADGEDETATPKKLWTDLPGIPKGLP